MMAMNREAQSTARDWIVLANDSAETLEVFLEPWAIGCEIPPDSYFDVYLPTANGKRPIITFTSGMIIIMTNCIAIFHNGAEVWDFSFVEGLRPPDAPEPFVPDAEEEGA